MTIDAERRRIEVVHESLLTHWPRLVRWRTQDADGAQLRDQLRQSAEMWEQHGRGNDFLWSGTAFREFQLWRENYPGGLTSQEEAFARAMTVLAERRRRRQQAILATLLTAIVLVAVVLGLMWRRGVAEARRAEAAAHRATAAKLLALAEASLSSDPTSALAYTIESLRLADTPEARRFAVRVLWSGPTVRVAPKGRTWPWGLEFSKDGSKLGAGYWNGDLRVYDDKGGEPFALETLPDLSFLSFSRDGTIATSACSACSGNVTIWSSSSWKRLRIVTLGSGILWPSPLSETEMLWLDIPPSFLRGAAKVQYGRWQAKNGRTVLGSFMTTTAPGINKSADRFAFALGRDVYLRDLDEANSVLLGTHPEVFSINDAPIFDPRDRYVAAGDEGGNVILWSLDPPGRKLRQLVAPSSMATFGAALSHDGSHLCLPRGLFTALWELEGVAGAEPIVLPSPGGTQMSSCAFHPERNLIATLRGERVALWELTPKRAYSLRGHDGAAGKIVFSPDSRYLYSIGFNDGQVIRWPLQGSIGERETVIDTQPRAWAWGIAVDPQNRFLIVTTRDRVRMVPFDGRPATDVERFAPSIPGAEIDPNGQFAVTSRFMNGIHPDLTLLDLQTGERRELGSEAEGPVNGWMFDAHGDLVVVRGGKLQLLDVSTGRARTLIAAGAFLLGLSPDGKTAVTDVNGKATLIDLESGKVRTAKWNVVVRRPEVNNYNLLPGCALGPNGTAVEVRSDGTLRAGSLEGGEPHLLYGAGRVVFQVAVSPDGRWVAASSDRGLHLWPMPDLRRPPIHTLSHGELTAKLGSLTNLRAVADAASPTGYRIDVDDSAYHGWAKPSEW